MSSTDIFISNWLDVCYWSNISKTMLWWYGLLVLFVLLAAFPWNMARPQLHLLSLTVKKLRCQASYFILWSQNLQYKTHSEFWPSHSRIFKTSLYLYLKESENGNFKFNVDAHQLDLRLHHFSQFHLNVLKKKIKSWQVCDWLAKWLIMSGYMDLRWPRVYRRSNVGLVLGCAISSIACAKHRCTGGWLILCHVVLKYCAIT